MDCTHVTPACPVEATTYGYYPNFAGNLLMLIVFAICAIAQVYLGVRFHVRLYTSLVFLGCLGEVVGYAGRLIMHSNPWSNTGFIIQTLLLILSPSFLAAGLYLTLKHLVLYYGPQLARLKPQLYTWVFITCDAIGFVTQLVGGGIQATAVDGKGSKGTVEIGTYVMIAGIAFQATTMGLCGILAVDFARRVHKHGGKQGDGTKTLPSPKGPTAFVFYTASNVVAFLTILTRCIYRIPEMAGGWGNKLMRSEAKFMVLDGAMVAVGAILMTVAFPGAYFPAISNRATHGEAGKRQSCSENELHLAEVVRRGDVC